MQQHNLGNVTNSIPCLYIETSIFGVTTVKESLKSIHVWQCYARNKKGAVFWTHDRITEADDRYTHATTVGVNNNEHSTYVSTPDVGIEDLVLLVEIKNLDQRQSEFDGDCDWSVSDWTSDYPYVRVVSEQIFDQSFLVWQRSKRRFGWHTWSDCIIITIIIIIIMFWELALIVRVQSCLRAFHCR